MARSDHTKPYIVKLWDGDLAREAVHDHRSGLPCDLPRSLADEVAAGSTRCFWGLRYTGVQVCPCGMCRCTVPYRRMVAGQRRSDRDVFAEAAKRWRGGDGEAFGEIPLALTRRY